MSGRGGPVPECPAWCVGLHRHANTRASGEVVHWRPVLIPALGTQEVAYVYQRDRWTNNPSFLSSSRQEPAAVLSTYWTTVPLDDTNTAELHETILAARNLVRDLWETPDRGTVPTFKEATPL